MLQPSVNPVTVPLTRPTSVTASQELNSVTVQGSCQSKTFHSPNASQQAKQRKGKKEMNQGDRRTEVTTNLDY